MFLKMKRISYTYLLSLIARTLSALIVLPLCSCFQDFEPDIKTTPVVCLNSLVTEGELIKLSVTRTWRWSEGNLHDDEATVLKDAEVKLYVNDRYQETLRYTEEPALDFNETDKYYYLSSYCPAIGDRLRFEVSTSGYGDAHAEVEIPEKVDISDVRHQVRITDRNENADATYVECMFDLSMKVGFDDPAGKENYYVFELSQTRPEGHIENGLYIPPDYYENVICSFDVDLEPLFSEHISPLESIISDNYGWTVFSDRQIEGRHYSLNIVCDNVMYQYNATQKPETADHSATIDIRLCSISKSYYDFMISLWQAEQGVSGALGGVGLGNPVWEKSNVSTGAGIIAARTVSTVRLNEWELIQ